MKSLLTLSVFAFIPVCLFAQNLGGIWTGTLTNDSTHKKQNFELGLSEYRGKITGYTYTTFIENDTFYYSIKRIKAERKDGFLVIEDDEMVGNNFPERAAKKVKQTTIFPLINDSTIDIANGRWSTNQTKKYYSIGGAAGLKEEQNEQESDLVSHLSEMKVKNNIVARKTEDKKDLVVNKPQKEPAVALNQTKQDKNIVLPKKDIIPVTNSNSSKEEIKKNEPVMTNTKPITESKQQEVVVIKQPEQTKTAVAEIKQTEIVNKNPVSQNTTQPKQELATTNNNSVINDKVVNTNKNDLPPARINTPPQSTAIKKQDPAIVQSPEKPSIGVNKAPVTKATNTVSVNTPVVQKKEAIETLQPLPAIVATRKSESIQDIYFHSDSLVLSLYDNGIVDGDTVSVFLNGENIISKQKLKEAAVKKTIYITSAMPDSLQLVLFAENLGSIPPNTGLLTVRDGDIVYPVRFSADLKKNASITLRRKKE